VEKDDPDIITTNGGDSFDFPYIYKRAEKHGISLQFGRTKDKDPKKAGHIQLRQIFYKPQGHILSGRLHLDPLRSCSEKVDFRDLLTLQGSPASRCRNSRV